jgi:hypothetical protein
MTLSAVTRRNLITGALVGVTAWPSLASAFSKTFPLTDAFPYLDKFLALPVAERSHLNLTYKMVAKAGGFGGVRIFLISPTGQKSPLNLGSTGHIEPLPSLSMLKGDYQLLVERPDTTKLGIAMDLLPAFALTSEVSPRDPIIAITQANAAIRKVAGPAGLILPKLKQVVFKGSVSGMILQASGSASPMPLLQGAPSFEPQRNPTASQIKLTKAPSALEFEG